MPTIQFFQPHEGRRFDGPLDLNEHLIRHPAATFFMRAGADGARDTGIRAGDLLVIDRAVVPATGRTVIVVRNGDLRIECLHWNGEEDGIEVWGVITHVIHRF